MAPLQTLPPLGLAFLAALGASLGHAAAIEGTATYRERMALPPQAVFEATLEEVSRADAPNTVLGRARIEGPGNPPLRFSIDYDPATVEPGHRYAVRARITVDGRPMFITDTSTPVLGPGQAPRVDLTLAREGGPRPTPQTRRLHGLFTYMADAGLFTDCASGHRLPVATEGDNAALEAAYSLARPAPAAPLRVAVDGRVESRPPMEGPKDLPTLIVDRFVEVLPGDDCPAPPAGGALPPPTLRPPRRVVPAARGPCHPPRRRPCSGISCANVERPRLAGSPKPGQLRKNRC